MDQLSFRDFSQNTGRSKWHGQVLDRHGNVFVTHKQPSTKGKASNTPTDVHIHCVQLQHISIPWKATSITLLFGYVVKKLPRPCFFTA